jgi:PAS domain S-box-containing protein
MFGYSADELNHLTVEDLLPESFASLHRAYRKRYMRDPGIRKMGSGLDLRGRKKDGVEFHVDVMLSPFQVGRDYLVVAVIRDDTVRHREKEALEDLLHSLQAERAKVQTLKSLLPICAWCKKIRDDSGYWTMLEEYFHEHADVDFTHGICPDCAKKIEEKRIEPKNHPAGSEKK